LQEKQGDPFMAQKDIREQSEGMKDIEKRPIVQ
jgi:hypothetical protein